MGSQVPERVVDRETVGNDQAVVQIFGQQYRAACFKRRGSDQSALKMVPLGEGQCRCVAGEREQE